MIARDVIRDKRYLLDIAGQGIGGYSLCDVTASKLEYADDACLLDWMAAEASKHVSALASGSRTSASTEMSAPKSNAMHVHNIPERLPVSKGVEVEALDLPHRFPECDSMVSTLGNYTAYHREVVSQRCHQAFVRHSNGCSDTDASVAGLYPADADSNNYS